MLVFISSPFSHTDKAVEKYRTEEVNKFVAKLTSEGVHAFSPITYGTILLNYHDMPSDWKFWKDFCEAFLIKCDEVRVLMLEGWDVSEGVQAEIDFAVKHGIPVSYIDVSNLLV